jgi:hypothetical protein
VSNRSLTVSTVLGGVLAVSAITAAYGQFSPPTPAELAAAKAKVEVRLKEAASKPTPRTADGRPDLTGYWVNLSMPSFSFGPAATAQSGKVIETHIPPPQQVSKFEAAQAARELAAVDTRPQFKSAADAAKQRDNFLHNTTLDPAYGCGAPGVARDGAPNEIVQTKNAVYLLYTVGIGTNRFRVVPTDGRAHDASLDAMPDGDSVGRWSGDSLIIDTINIDPDSWVDNDGTFHSDSLHVVETLSRKGNELTYKIRFEDPLYVTPFERSPVVSVLGSSEQHIQETYPCKEKSVSHMVPTITRLDSGLSDDNGSSAK